MAICERKDRAKPWQVYWKNPFTGKRESKSFAAKEEAIKENSLIKHRMKFEREWFRPAAQEVQIEHEEPKELTLEQAYFLYLKEKQFSKKSLTAQIAAMRAALALYGKTPFAEIRLMEIKTIASHMEAHNIKQLTRHKRMPVLRIKSRFELERGKGLFPLCSFSKNGPWTL